MSRSGYVDDGDNLGLYRATVARATNGKRGQRLLREMAAALDAMPVKELAEGVLVEDGAACALGVVALARGLDVSSVDESEPEDVAKAFDIAQSLAAEVAYQNDECGSDCETPAQRWTRMRRWVARQVLPTGESPADLAPPTPRNCGGYVLPPSAEAGVAVPEEKA